MVHLQLCAASIGKGEGGRWRAAQAAIWNGGSRRRQDCVPKRYQGSKPKPCPTTAFVIAYLPARSEFSSAILTMLTLAILMRTVMAMSASKRKVHLLSCALPGLEAPSLHTRLLREALTESLWLLGTRTWMMLGHLMLELLGA